MALKLSLELSEVIDLPCDLDKAFDFFMDVPKTAECFPKVDTVKDLGDNKYHWVMTKEGVGKYSIQVEYGAHYSFDRDKGIVEWTSIPGIGNGVSRGKSVITSKGGKTQVNFSTTMDLELPLPGLAKPLIKPFVNREFEKSMEKFRDNVIKALS
ncbi:MAG: SRPBCC family protein [Desulfatibacillum sp.]|nr:SRPBCC family protein [Desulfatibacillum sp.]